MHVSCSYWIMEFPSVLSSCQNLCIRIRDKKSIWSGLDYVALCLLICSNLMICIINFLTALLEYLTVCLLYVLSYTRILLIYVWAIPSVYKQLICVQATCTHVDNLQGKTCFVDMYMSAHACIDMSSQHVQLAM